MAVEDQTVKADLVATARDRFTFLLGRGARLESTTNAWQPVDAYVMPKLTVEVQLDFMDDAVVVLIGRTVDGQRPPGILLFEQGRTVRRYLVAALELAGLADSEAAAELRKAYKGSGEAAMRRQLDVFSSALRSCVDLLEQRLDLVFPAEPTEERRSG